MPHRRRALGLGGDGVVKAASSSSSKLAADAGAEGRRAARGPRRRTWLAVHVHPCPCLCLCAACPCPASACGVWKSRLAPAPLPWPASLPPSRWSPAEASPAAKPAPPTAAGRLLPSSSKLPASKPKGSAGPRQQPFPRTRPSLVPALLLAAAGCDITYLVGARRAHFRVTSSLRRRCSAQPVYQTR